MKDYYRLLDINEDASKDEIKKAYKILAQKYHPDLHMEKDHDNFERKMKEINEAYETLINEEKREVYNNQLDAEKEKFIHPTISTSQSTAKINQAHKFMNVMMISFSILSLIAIIIITAGIYHYFFKNLDVQNEQNINFGLSETKAIKLLGEPITKTKHLLVYDGYQIIIRQGSVDGWLDASGKLDVGYQKTPEINDLKVGDDMLFIIDDYGNPDTYSDELAVYDNIVLYLEDGRIKQIEKIEKEQG